jgi:hypothetical protein
MDRSALSIYGSSREWMPGQPAGLALTARCGEGPAT